MSDPQREMFKEIIKVLKSIDARVARIEKMHVVSLSKAELEKLRGESQRTSMYSPGLSTQVDPMSGHLLRK